VNVPAASTKSTPKRKPLRRIGKAMKRSWRHAAVRLGLRKGPASRGYMICTLPRSGSTYLCQLLQSTQVLGKPDEYFNTPAMRTHRDPKYPKDPLAQLDIVRSLGATTNGIYGVKLMTMHLALIAGRIDPFHDLPNVVLLRLTRRDLLSQAVSLARARQTRQFDAKDPQQGVPTYSATRIHHCLLDLQRQQAKWDNLFAQLAAQPLSFDYEELSRDPQHFVDLVAARMGIVPPVAIDWASVTRSIQRDDSTREWRARFLEETGSQYRHLAAP
jgi:LPS sulfotransferase NodH